MSPKKINTKNIIDGTVRKRIVRLQPKYNVINPNVNVLKTAPIGFIEPIQESCSFVKGPVFNGVSSDNRYGVAGAIQPIIQPWLAKIKFAVIIKFN